MQFNEKQLDLLTKVLYEDALNTEEESVQDGIRYEQLKAQMMKHPGLLENLSIRY